MKKAILILICALVFLFAFAACSNRPQGEPKVILEQYLFSLDKGDYEAAYDLLSKENKSQITLEEFKDWQYQYAKIYKSLGDSSVSKEVEMSEYSFNGVDYSHAYGYTYLYKENNYMTGKDESGEGTKIVVSEDGKWKLLDENNYRTKYAAIMDYVGWAYREGKSFDKDLNTAITYFLKSIEIDPEYIPVYYDIAYTYEVKEQYEKALDYINTGINKGDEAILSDYYNIKGVILEDLNKNEEAKIAYEKALEIDPNNVYATDNLAMLE